MISPCCWISSSKYGVASAGIGSGESLEAAFQREVHEENGLSTMDVQLVKIQSGYNLRLEVFYEARVLSDGEPVLRLQTSEVLEARFFSCEALPPNLLPEQKEIIATVFDSPFE